MGDSDEEYDRRRGRDKFRRERSDYQERRDERSRGRDDWPERDSWSAREVRSRRDYRDYDVGSRRRERYSPARHELSPPVKRMRRDWDDRGGYGGGGGGFEGGFPPMGGGGPHHGGGPWAGPGGPQEMGMAHGPHGGGYGGPGMAGGGPNRDPEQGLTQPPMMTFKQFLSSQDDTIDDQEAVRKYNEYKMDFRRQQLNEFFVNHKEEEWFKSKYHPEECVKRKAEQAAALNRRLDAFLRLQDAGWIDSVSIDVEKSDRIVRLLDAVVIMLEGGNENDLKVLDEPTEEEKCKDAEPYASLGAKEEKSAVVKEEKTESENEGAIASPQQSEETNQDEENVKEEEEDDDEDSNSKEKGRQRKYSYSEDNSSSSSNSDSSSAEDDADSGVPGEDSGSESKSKKKKRKKMTVVVKKEEEDTASKDADEEEDEEAQKDASVEEEDAEDKEAGDGTTVQEEKDARSGGEEQVKKEEEERPGVKEEDQSQKPRPLHKTCSIFLRNLAPTITKAEVEAMCKRYPGFLRVAIADPQPERRFFRRGWVTFERTVNIKEICWNLNNIRLRDCELGAIVNRDLSRRIRSVNGIASHKQVVRSDIKLAARIVQNLDLQRGLWGGDASSAEVKDSKDNLAASFGASSKNPLLKNITDYLIEEASAEEEELLGGVADQEEQKETEEGGATLDKDDALIKVLDRLLLYLRIVHSVDYYNHSEYSSEDEMPNRCGIMHARGSPPSSKVTPQEISDYISHFETKISSFLQPSTKLSPEEAARLGKKDPEAEVEKFVAANTQELAKDKWLCPLSGKKFKGPEFVRKHIFNKHAEKVDEVRKEVEFFNNYLMDAKRPQLPDHPANRGGGGGMRGPDGGHGGMMGGPFHAGFPPPPPFGFNRGHAMGFPGFGGRNFPDPYRGGFKRNAYGRSPRGGEARKLITYRDLDAPNDVDFI